MKTRAGAARLVEGGGVRVNQQRVTTAHKLIGIDDVLTIALEREVKVLRVVGPGERRGPYSEARLLYADLTILEKGAPP